MSKDFDFEWLGKNRRVHELCLCGHRKDMHSIQCMMIVPSDIKRFKGKQKESCVVYGCICKKFDKGLMLIKAKNYINEKVVE